MASTNFNIEPTDPIYRDFTFLNFSHIDAAIDRAFENYSIASELDLKYDEQMHTEGQDSWQRLLPLQKEAKRAAEYWVWCHQGLKDLRYRDKLYPEMLTKSVSGLVGVPPEEQNRFKGYHDGFYFEYFRRNDDPEWLKENDPSWVTKKLMFGPPPLKGYDLNLSPTLVHQ